ncbi:DUF6702 family protein [Flagellimonas lutaonensis]|uniref:Peptidase E n=1 Tax=Flagellimonas lutaonensis TaxID=516051 RepID=A0A0D5YV78_9FLAO|nr:DUF6702 family protein [Allomuricauda lutaonensis]AKA35753.1 hypothetical protein VC82_2159 [Allomuricauda lutaonensis]
MKILKSAPLVLTVLFLTSMTVAHKFYVSVTNVNYSEEEDALQITSRIFIDDLERVLEERYDVDPELATKKEADFADAYIEKYLRAKFSVLLDNKPVSFNFLGKRYDNDVIICYLEVLDVNLAERSSIAVQNEVLTDLFEEQQNVVHIKWMGKKKSFVLIKENNKGMLNL